MDFSAFPDVKGALICPRAAHVSRAQRNQPLSLDNFSDWQCSTFFCKSSRGVEAHVTLKVADQQELATVVVCSFRLIAPTSHHHTSLLNLDSILHRSIPSILQFQRQTRYTEQVATKAQLPLTWMAGGRIVPRHFVT